MALNRGPTALSDGNTLQRRKQMRREEFDQETIENASKAHVQALTPRFQHVMACISFLVIQIA